MLVRNKIKLSATPACSGGACSFLTHSQEKGTENRPDACLAGSARSQAALAPPLARSALFPVPVATPRPPLARVGPGPEAARPPPGAGGGEAGGASRRLPAAPQLPALEGRLPDGELRRPGTRAACCQTEAQERPTRQRRPASSLGLSLADRSCLPTRSHFLLPDSPRLFPRT